MKTKTLSVLGALALLLSAAPVPAAFAEGDAPAIETVAEADPEPCGDRCPDLGDAPDSNNSLGNVMSIHPFGLVPQPASYPTEYTAAAGTGPIHWNAGSNINPFGAPGNAIDSALGIDVFQGNPFSRVSNERNAFLLPDQDTRKRNIIPAPVPANGRSNRDGFDNAFVGPAGNRLPMQLAPCKAGNIRYSQYIRAPWSMNEFYSGTRYINVWVDLNQDGDWADSFAAPCPDKPNATTREWLVQNAPAPATSGVYTLPVNIANAIAGFSVNTPVWLRISISDSPAPANSIGNGPATGYRFGETEDHLMCYRPALDVWTNCPSLRVKVNEQEADGEFRIDAGRDVNGFTKPITITDIIDDDALYPVTVVWSIDAQDVQLISPNLSAQSVDVSNGIRITFTVPSALSPRQPVVLGWYGCITCTMMSAASASSPAGGLALPPPGTANVRITDASGYEMSEDFVVNVGWRVFTPAILRKPEE